MRQSLFWSPRILGILFAAFVSLFALDVFEQGVSLEAIGGFLIHLFPVYLLIIVLILAWRWELIGAVSYPLLGVLYIALAHGFPWQTYALMSGPPVLIGVLFLLDWSYRRRSP
jgi:hypothetical protein